MGKLELRTLTKRFSGAAVSAVKNVDLTVEQGERFAIVGPSGSGKTTLLRLIAGLETSTSGEIVIGGKTMNEVPPRSRGVAMVFQNPALYPHLDVFANLTFGLRARRVSRADRNARGREIADLLGLSALLTRKPAALSGGERQRVALGRAIAVNPSILLLDEPFSGLDAPLRASLRAVLFDLHRRSGWTMILVTHYQNEALATGDRMSLMRLGMVEQTGTPLDLYRTPANRFVAEFLGDPPASLLPCRVEKGRLWIAGREYDVDVDLIDSAVWIGLRAEHVTSTETGPRIPATLERIEPRGYESIAWFRVGDQTLAARVAADFGAKSGTASALAVNIRRALWFDHAGNGINK